MNLAARRSISRKNDMMGRLGAYLVVVSMLLTLAFPPQEARAAPAAATVVPIVAAAFLSACGINLAASGMQKSGITDHIADMIQDWLDDTRDSELLTNWADEYDDIETMKGKLLVPGSLAAELADFAQWVKEKYSVQAGEETNVYTSGRTVTLSDGNTYVISLVNADDTVLSYGTLLPSARDVNLIVLYFDSGDYIRINKSSYFNDEFHYMTASNQDMFGLTSSRDVSIGLKDNKYLCFVTERGQAFGQIEVEPSSRMLGTASSESLDIVGGSSISIPDADSIPAEKTVAIDVGAEADASYDDILDKILSAIEAGQLAATDELVDAETGTGEGTQEGEAELPDIDSLGLPSLGEALTSRFPFSIPWDVFRAVKLLAAPAKTPYFEVDFFAPMSNRVGGWKGSTKLVLDFSDYEIIGQVSRWTSMIGFCLALAAGTKRLIWTA